ncbi:MAG: hypothetical protein H0W24_02740 [Lysobacter sp.]|nr:hypothetical protein [Lysobacter sp.]MDQ3269456.1 hypothetical protein [Pseudomonadota bacterium]
MKKTLDEMFATRLEEVAHMAADAIVEATGDESAPHVQTFRQFDPTRSQLPASDLHHLLRTAEHVYGREHPKLSVKLLRYSRVAQRTR